ncbi:MAG: L-lysine 6-transaminase [Candidatus Thermoplasmatota archaeon]|jgi:L-lysine 6-transaminase|nr:L-lysine 6-transaminase [Candidatus Thermoplasmatota archaeon]
MSIKPTDVHKILARYMLVDGFNLVLDLRKSKGCRIYDSRNNRYMLDCFSFFATAPLGCNHPKLTSPDFIKKMGEVAINNPTNSDVYTVEMAEFVEAFSKYAMPNNFKHLFFVSGGALAVENGLKTAFDWKIRKNIASGKGELGTQVVHFKEAFHGRTGYTLSMTNTFNLNKTKYFTKFNWPRIVNPKIHFPLNKENLENVKKLERQAVDEIREAVAKNPDDIAALIIEPIQGEGGDNHFRREFFHELRRLCDEHEMMFILDEVQTGVGLTGKMWAYQHFDFEPDIIAFGKKTQVCGIMVNDRVDEIEDNVFKVPSRLNSTWGGNLVDMVRCQKYLEVIDEEDLIKNAEVQGKRLLEGLEEIEKKYPNKISNARGRGLMCAFDLPTPKERDEMKDKLYTNNLLVLSCGSVTIRFRPPLTISSEEVDEALEIVDKTVKSF